VSGFAVFPLAFQCSLHDVRHRPAVAFAFGLLV
jgi:hypothetical protein